MRETCAQPANSVVATYQVELRDGDTLKRVGLQTEAPWISNLGRPIRQDVYGRRHTWPWQGAGRAQIHARPRVLGDDRPHRGRCGPPPQRSSHSGAHGRRGKAPGAARKPPPASTPGARPRRPATSRSGAPPTRRNTWPHQCRRWHLKNDCLGKPPPATGKHQLCAEPRDSTVVPDAIHR